ncbi:MAG: sigma-54 dependent transcriptional regulator, partial [Oleiphilaceae bacterium]|nr:sigma-54 dependent transcriptional regulator [Oleiphilaceae bacterium]
MKHQTALIVDDEPDIRELLEITLIRMGLDTQSAATVNEAKALLAESDFSLCLTDMNLPDGNGIELVRHIQQDYPEVPVAMITAYGSVETAIEALKTGAFDFISKPVNLAQLRDLVSSALKLDVNQPTSPPSAQGDEVTLEIQGQSPLIKQLNQQIAKLARSQAPVYIAGESGSGKELAARMIHRRGPRADAPFIPVNCGAIPSELMESEFFGHKKGSFSGAHEDKQGLFKAANGGTLFLDEVADLPLDMQVKLLRAIQEKAVRAVGSQQEENIDVRILSATHKDLESLVQAGRFRQDLYYRINVIRLDVPSLRERPEDIAMLARHFLGRVAEEHGFEHASISQEALAALEAHAFPGNVREL